MKIAVSGKGGAGKTMISGTIARALARAGHDVIALDADDNPMLGISLGLGMDGTERLAGIRQGLSESEVKDAVHEHTIEGIVIVPEDPVIARADAEGIAPIDLDESSPGVRAIIAISERLVAVAV